MAAMKILIVDDEKTARYGMSRALKGQNRIINEAENGQAALDHILNQAPDLVFLDLNMPEFDGMFLLKELQKHSEIDCEIIVVTANEGVNYAVDCIRHGATDFLTKPFDIDHLRSIASRTEKRVRLQHEVDDLNGQSNTTFGRLIGVGRPMQQLYSQITKAAKTNLPILIRGESGTGKELVAKELHDRSPRHDQPFVAVNMAAVNETLIESELFGHVKGAFTGADRDRDGVFRKADGGSLFLDEIGDMPAAVQTRLLRVLQEGVVQPVGSEQIIKVDVRILSATHQDLDSAIQEKLFRQDLYFRLKGIELFLPALRNRHEDILLLANHFAEAKTFSKDAVAALMQHSWPGNVRELQQMVLAATALCETDRMTARDLGLIAEEPGGETSAFEKYFDQPLSEARSALIADFETAAIQRALEAADGNVSAAARQLGMHRQSLQQKMKTLGIDRK